MDRKEEGHKSGAMHMQVKKKNIYLLEEQKEDYRFNVKQISRHVHFRQGLFIATQCGLIFSSFLLNFSICHRCHNRKWVLNPFTLLPVC